MGRRARSEGTVYKDKHGTWWAQLPTGTDGRRPRRKAPTEREATKLLRQLHREREAGRDLSKRAETVEHLMTDWLATMQRHIRPSTRQHYQTQVGHITRRLGHVKVQALTVELVQRLADDLGDDGQGPAAVRQILSRLHAACERLIPERLSFNPVAWKRLKLAKATQAERRPLAPAEVRRLLVAADDLDRRGGDARYAPAVWLLALTGARRGEVLGLTWRDVSFERGEISIRQQRAPRSGALLSDPKTPQSVRTIPMGPRLAARLQAHWELLQAERRHRGARWREHGLVVCAEDGTPPSLMLPGRHLGALGRALGLSVTPHLLRHTAASILDELGYSETVIGALLGHTAGKSTTRRYTHARAETLRRAIEDLERAVLGAAAEAAKEAI